MFGHSDAVQQFLIECTGIKLVNVDEDGKSPQLKMHFQKAAMNKIDFFIEMKILV
jgi:hypothetical protein